MTKRERWTYLFLWAFLGLVPLMVRPLWDPDEARYAEIPREMLEKGDWLTPTLNYVRYFEKPPLQYWLSALSIKLFGLTAFAARLPLGLAWLGVLWCAWRLARRLGSRDPRWAMFMTASGLLAFVCGQLLTLDALFSAFLVLALTAAVEAVAARMEERPHRAWTLLAFAALSAAFLTKGLAAVVLAGGALLFSLAFAGEARLRRAVLWTLLNPAGLALGGLLTAPWFVLVNRANPGHAAFFFIHEHFTRFSTHAHARQGSDNPVLDKLYFVGILALGLLPWLSASLVGLRRGWAFVRTARRGPQATGGPLHRWTVGLLLLAFAWPLLFFSLSGSKLPPYVLPVVVPLMALACAFEREGEELRAVQRMGWEMIVLGLVFLGAGLGFSKELGGGLGWILALGLAFGLYGAWCLRPNAFLGGLTTARMMGLQASCLLLLTFAADAAATPGKDVAPLVRLAPREARWISAGVYFQGLPLSSRSRAVVVAGTGELDFGKGRLDPAEQARWFVEELEGLVPAAESLRAEAPGRPVWVLVKERSWKELGEGERARFEIMGRLKGVVAVRLK